MASLFPEISAGGRYVAYASAASNLVPGDTNDLTDIFVHDRRTDVTERVSVASDGTQTNDNSSALAISASGRYITFISDASNLVTGDTNEIGDIFVHDRRTDLTERVSVATDGTEANEGLQPAISANGRYVTFTSDASNLVPGDNTPDEPGVLWRRRYLRARSQDRSHRARLGRVGWS